MRQEGQEDNMNRPVNLQLTTLQRVNLFSPTNSMQEMIGFIEQLSPGLYFLEITSCAITSTVKRRTVQIAVTNTGYQVVKWKTKRENDQELIKLIYS